MLFRSPFYEIGHFFGGRNSFGRHNFLANSGLSTAAQGKTVLVLDGINAPVVLIKNGADYHHHLEYLLIVTTVV